MNGHWLTAAVDWTQVLVVGVPLYIGATFSGVAAIISSRNRKALRTSNGQSIAEHVEATHAAVNEGVAMVNEINDRETPPAAPPVAQV